MLKIQSLASGSKGNITYIASETTHILVDVGLSLPQAILRLQSADINPESINAILITHEHSDHIKGVYAFLKKYKCKIYMQSTAAPTFIKYIGSVQDDLISTFCDKFEIGDISIDYFPVPHDSNFCFGYTFQKNDCKISIATDLGRTNSLILEKMAQSQIVMLESNHDLTKLYKNVKYPPALKRRVSSGTGHLSNTAASLAIYELVKHQVRQIILAHLSEENNSPSLAYTFVRDFLSSKGLQEGVDISIDVANQHNVGRLFELD